MRLMDTPEFRFLAFSYAQIEPIVKARQAALDEQYGDEPVTGSLTRDDNIFPDDEEAAEAMRVHLCQHPDTNPDTLLVIIIDWRDGSAYELFVTTIDNLSGLEWLAKHVEERESA